MNYKLLALLMYTGSATYLGAESSSRVQKRYGESGYSEVVLEKSCNISWSSGYGDPMEMNLSTNGQEGWVPKPDDKDPWLIIDCGSKHQFYGITVRAAGTNRDYLLRYQVFKSDDGVNFEEY